MELRALTVIDSLQPQLTGFLQTVCAGFMPLEEEAAAFIEIAPGIAINQLTDAALKATTCRPGMQIVERAYGMLELHNRDKGQVEAAVDAIVGRMGVKRDERLKPRIVSSQIITGIDGHQSQLLKMITFGAFGRLWLGGWEAEIKAAVAAAEGALAKINGREAKS